ncbi:hypothetical protein GE253_04995 [Niveispirillum sp. SYP-B3756]|uniref:contractile injection system protein, VgrG/Pvc8 family n=1 Tax=Niveispirillum sp. SYP-B3756 TaxID=2662178 RepID=UPI001291373C|nr:contractile injection system protein, VgrG/Pvc8 family [Niveispirillum sp. SYP-B3756]MQP64700.1 hypothetical protein [Niveispirillum sp. SYP-B3756]
MVTVKNPDWRIVADGVDATAKMRDRLLRLRVSDEAGIESDTAEIELDNRDGALALPRTGAELQVFLGWRGGALVDMGLYVVDEIRTSGMPRTMVISANAADMRRSFKAQKTTSWHDTTIGAIVATIGAAHGLAPVVAPELAGVQIPHMDQTGESDMAFLSRIARQYDAVAKPAYGKLIFVPRGQAKAASGRQMATVSMSYAAGDISSWRTTIADRGRYGAVKAHWHDQGAGERKVVIAGGEEPSMTLPNSFPNEAAARAAAAGKLAALTRGTATLSLTGPGRLDLFAEGRVVLAGCDAAADGEWSITKVEHSLGKSEGLTFSLEAETPRTTAPSNPV